MGCKFVAADWTRQKLCPLGRLYRHSVEENKLITSRQQYNRVKQKSSKKSCVLELFTHSFEKTLASYTTMYIKYLLNHWNATKMLTLCQQKVQRRFQKPKVRYGAKYGITAPLPLRF